MDDWRAIKLNDGTKWRVHADDHIRGWLRNHSLILALRESGEYLIINLETKSSVRVAFIQAPQHLLNQAQIADCNYLSNIVTLSDGKKFQMANEADITKWKKDDFIILGMYRSPFDENYDPDQFMLFHTASNSHAHATLTR